MENKGRVNNCWGVGLIKMISLPISGKIRKKYSNLLLSLAGTIIPVDFLFLSTTYLSDIVYECFLMKQNMGINPLPGIIISS